MINGNIINKISLGIIWGLLVSPISLFSVPNPPPVKKELTPLKQIEKRAKKLENEIMAPCCFGGTLVSHSESSLTIEMKENLRVMLKRGLTDEQVIDKMVEHYGKKMGLPPNEWQRIRATPQKTGFNLLVWILPILGALFGAMLVIWIIYVFVKRSIPLKKDGADMEPKNVSSEMEKRIEDELNKIEVL